MIRAVLDTNVLVSALIPGTSRSVLDQANVSFELVLSSAIITELDGVLQRPKIVKWLKLTADQRVRFLAHLETTATLVPGLVDVPSFDPDPKDTPILAAAVESKADFVVTGDHELLNLGSYHETKIVTTRAFLEILG